MGVKLDYRELKTGNISPRLIIYKSGKQIIENIDIIIYPGDPDKRSKREACEKIRTKREYEMIMGDHGLPVGKKAQLFSKAVNKVIDSGTIKRVKIYRNMLAYVIEVFGDKKMTSKSCAGIWATRRTPTR